MAQSKDFPAACVRLMERGDLELVIGHLQTELTDQVVSLPVGQAGQQISELLLTYHAFSSLMETVKQVHKEQTGAKS